MTFAQDLNTHQVVLYDGDSRSRQLVIWPQEEGDEVATVCTTGNPENESWDITDLEEEEIGGHWVLSAVHTNGDRAWWHEGDQEWKDGTPT